MLEISIECSQVEGSARPYNVQYRRDTNQPIKHRGWLGALQLAAPGKTMVAVRR